MSSWLQQEPSMEWDSGSLAVASSIRSDLLLSGRQFFYFLSLNTLWFVCVIAYT